MSLCASPSASVRAKKTLGPEDFVQRYFERDRNLRGAWLCKRRVATCELDEGWAPNAGVQK